MRTTGRSGESPLAPQVMPKQSKPASSDLGGDSEVRLLAWLATCASILAFLFYFEHGQVLLYGDAIAHINIARRVFDSKTPGLLQLGTVWLPLPHLLMIPFLLSTEMWRGGAGGSLPSMAAYVFSVIGIFRLTRSALSPNAIAGLAARIAAWIAALVYAANPNLIYLQATAMGETLYLAFFIWSVVFFSESTRGEKRALVKCGLCLAAASLTRYDGWFLAAGMAGMIVLWSFLAGDRTRFRLPPLSGFAVTRFVLIAGAAPALWLAYNGIVYRNPLEFENGPYSAKAIERRTQSGGNQGHPGSDHPVLAGQYFVKSAEANLAPNEWLQRTWIAMAVAAMVSAFFSPSMAISLILLLVPVPFYALSIAFSGVPIFIPYWWPFTHYNVRYGLQLLPVFAIAVGVVTFCIVRSTALERRFRFAGVGALLLFVAASYASIWRSSPICLKEAQVNMRTRTELQHQLSMVVSKLPANSTLLMYLGDQVGALERAGFPLKNTINEGNHRVWKQPRDTEGMWERALGDPANHADYVLAFEGDPVWQAVSEFHLRELVEIHVTGQPRAILYRTR